MNEFKNSIQYSTSRDSLKDHDQDHDHDRDRDYLILSPFRVGLICLDENNFTHCVDSSNSTEKNAKQLYSDFSFDNNYLDFMKKSDYLKYEECLIENFRTARNESQLLTTLALMWKDSKFCDLILVLANGREFLAHRAVLSFYSEKYKYFYLKNNYRAIQNNFW